MSTHVTVLGWLHVALNALQLVVGLALMVLFGGIGATLGAGGGHDAAPAAALFGGIGLFVFFILAVLSVPGIILGWALLSRQSWARILGIVFSILDLVNFPVGTALGIYGLVVLLNSETVALFESPRFA